MRPTDIYKLKTTDELIGTAARQQTALRCGRDEQKTLTQTSGTFEQIVRVEVFEQVVSRSKCAEKIT